MENVIIFGEGSKIKVEGHNEWLTVDYMSQNCFTLHLKDENGNDFYNEAKGKGYWYAYQVTAVLAETEKPETNEKVEEFKKAMHEETAEAAGFPTEDAQNIALNDAAKYAHMELNATLNAMDLAIKTLEEKKTNVMDSKVKAVVRDARLYAGMFSDDLDVSIELGIDHSQKLIYNIDIDYDVNSNDYAEMAALQVSEFIHSSIKKHCPSLKGLINIYFETYN